MGMDIYGNSPKNDHGEFFRANLWAWRPIHAICDKVIELYQLPFDTEGWEFNDGKGLETQEDCNLLANSIEKYIEFLTDVDEDDIIYYNMGMWCSTDGAMIDADECNVINQTCPIGSITTSGVVTASGNYVQPSHGTSVKRIATFIHFLRNCGGFSIL